MPLTPSALGQPACGTRRAQMIRRLMVLIGLLLAGVATGAEPGSTPALAELPREYVDTGLTESTGRTIHVPAGGDLQSALNSARLGDVITLAAGATYTGPFLLPKKEGTGWLVVRTDTLDVRVVGHREARLLGLQRKGFFSLDVGLALHEVCANQVEG